MLLLERTVTTKVKPVKAIRLQNLTNQIRLTGPPQHLPAQMEDRVYPERLQELYPDEEGEEVSSFFTDCEAPVLGPEETRKDGSLEREHSTGRCRTGSGRSVEIGKGDQG